MVAEHWIAHRRSDGELVGWIDMESVPGRLVVIDRLGRVVATVTEWDEAQDILDDLGLSFLTARFWWQSESGPLRVRIVELDDTRVVVTTAVTDAIGESAPTFEIPFPVPEDFIEVDGQ